MFIVNDTTVHHLLVGVTVVTITGVLVSIVDVLVVDTVLSGGTSEVTTKVDGKERYKFF